MGGEGLAAVRVEAARGDQPGPPGLVHRQVGGRGRSGRPFVKPGVGDRQTGDLAHRGLELEHHLESALGDLGLVRRVRSQELGTADDRFDDRRHVVVVHAGAEEGRDAFGIEVGVGEAGQQAVDLGFAHSVLEVEGPVQPDFVRDLREQLVDRVDPDRGQHFGLVGSGRRCVPRQARLLQRGGVSRRVHQ